jgi:hypothetical protein
LRHLPSKRVSCPLHSLIAGGVAVLAALACAGAMMEPPGMQGSPAVEIGARSAGLVQPPIVQAAEHPHAANVSSRNLQLPRAPRHRSERPTSGSVDAASLAAAAVFAILADDARSTFVGELRNGCPLAGHPLSLLRPPSLLAG